MSNKEKKISCHNCRKIKRKCDGANPCSNCLKRDAVCEYATADFRSQRFSVGYIKSLETTNEVYQNTLALLVSLRHEPEKLVAKLESLVTSVPEVSGQLMEIYRYSQEFGENLDPTNEAIDTTPIVDEESNFFGPGSIYHFSNYAKPDRKPFFESDTLALYQVVTLEQDFDYIHGLVAYFFDHQSPSLFLSILDQHLILKELKNHHFSGQFLSQELIYAICANCSKLTYAQADAYYDFTARMMFTNNLEPTLAKSQAYFLLSHHQLSKGQMLNGWLLSGLALRAGYDVGFDYPSTVNNAPNRLYTAGVINDFWLGLMIGRRTTIRLYDIPVLRLSEESETDYLVFKNSVELVEMAREMILSTYKPIAFDADPRVNYLMKFNRVKTFNMKLTQWQSRLDPKCHWLNTSLKSCKTLVTDNHMLKYLYYHILLFINKPFVRILRKHPSMHVIEEMTQNIYIIISARFEEMEKNSSGGVAALPNGEFQIMRQFRDSDQYNWLSIDVCLVTLLCNVLMYLMISLPEQYLYLEKQFVLFCRFLSMTSPRKYKYEDNPVALLYKKYLDFKAGLRGTELDSSPLQSLNSPDTLVGSNNNNIIQLPYERPQKEFVTPTEFSPSEIYMHSIPGEDASSRLGAKSVTFQSNDQAYTRSAAQVIPLMEHMALSDMNPAQPSQGVKEGKLPEKEAKFNQDVEDAHFLKQTGGYEDYDWNMDQTGADPWPFTQDSLNKMVNSMFTNTGQEFTVDKDWDLMFTDAHLGMM